MRFYSLFLIFNIICINQCLSQNTDSSSVFSVALSNTIKATVHVDNKQVPQNRQVKYIVKISWQGDLDRYEIEKLENPVLTNFEIVGNSSSNWVGELGGTRQAIKTYEFILNPLALGMGYIDGIFIEYTDQVYNKTDRLVTNRLEVKIIEPVKETSVRTWILSGSLLFLVLIITVGSISYVKKKKVKEAALKEKELAMMPIEDKYIADFKQEIDLKNVNMAETLSFLSKFLRRYLSERYQIPALEITTKEIGHELHKLAVSDELIEQVDEILKSCDVAKFSGGHVERVVLERAYTLVEDILNRNKTDYVELSNKNTEE